MGIFLESEKAQQEEFKRNLYYFSQTSQKDGVYKKKPRPFCLPTDCAQENLFPEIRETALAHFARHQIKWHDGQNGKPSNHLCDSQVCCVNFLFPFADKPEVLAQILRPFFPELDHMLAIESGQFVSFEWIGAENYLHEKISRNGQRTRGANFTSADAVVMFERRDTKRQIVLIEWKYTESYGSTNKTIAKSGTDRRKIYQHLFDAPDCPVDMTILPNVDALFYEPFYQFMRQQFLAHEMEKSHELGADIVSLLHIAPAHNHDFRRVTSPELVKLGDSATDIWKKLVMDKSRFLSVTTEELFGKLEGIIEINPWMDYIYSRYHWVCD